MALFKGSVILYQTSIMQGLSKLLLIVAITGTSPILAQNINTIAGRQRPGYGGDGGAATAASLNKMVSMATDKEGNLYVADFYNHAIRKITKDGIITTIAGNHTMGYSGDGGAATAAQLHGPWGIAVDTNGNVYFSDKENNAIRAVSKDGIITTVAGNGTKGYSGDGGPASAARLYHPLGLCLGRDGALYVADNSNTVVRKIAPNGIITTFAGNNRAGYSGDGGAATAASLYNVRALAADTAGNIYISDTWNSVIRKVNEQGIISTYAGNHTRSYKGDGGPATAAGLNYPVGIALDAEGNLYITDNFNHAIRQVTADGKITTIAGNGTKGYSGDGGPAVAARFNHPSGITISNGQLYVSDFVNNSIRSFSLGSARLSTPPNFGLRVYPIPTSSVLHIDIPEHHTAGTISVSDLHGRQITNAQIDETNNNYTLNLEYLASGMYLVKIIAGNIDYTAKIEVMH